MSQKLYQKSWEVPSPKAIVFVVHGMSEHIARYDYFAKQLNEHGISVIGNDLRGHGQTAKSIDEVGFFAQENGWKLVVQDCINAVNKINASYPDTPILMLGHSMGSFIVRDALVHVEDIISGAIISGTVGHPGLKGIVGKRLAQLLSFIKGKKTRSPLLMKLTFAGHLQRIKPARTNKDWLSRDANEVDKYINDPFCMQDFMCQFFVDLATGVLRVNHFTSFQLKNKQLPVFLFAGEDDPVGGYGKGPKEVFIKYQKAGLSNCELKLYPEGRHEMLNEVNKDEVIGDIIYWINHKIL